MGSSGIEPWSSVVLLLSLMRICTHKKRPDSMRKDVDGTRGGAGPKLNYIIFENDL